MSGKHRGACDHCDFQDGYPVRITSTGEMFLCGGCIAEVRSDGDEVTMIERLSNEQRLDILAFRSNRWATERHG